MNPGIYIHIPFCRSRCSYCDFATGMFEPAAADRYVRALSNEIRDWKQVAPAADVDTIYLGGGTPSLLTSEQIEHILRAVHERFEVAAGAEVTIEMNPGDGEAQQALRAWRELGITRVSFGAQTFDDEGLKQLGRTHTAADIRRTFQDLRAAGFTNINFDLIAGLSGQTLSRWEQNLDEAIALGPEHLSLYLLDVHEGTPLADQIRRGMRAQPDDDLTAEMYRFMIDRVCAAGYEHYEISNFCLPGHEARHNTKYWIGAPYYGFGCSAHSYDGVFQRWSNERDSARYTSLLEDGRSPIVETLALSERDVRAESMFLGLRMMRGLSLRELKARFGADPFAPYQSDLERFGAAGLIEIEGDLIKLTRHGALLSNEVFAAFV
ncbi:MAG: Oxygen-independent coproporphyrinogen-III oxidase-like protein [Acidobacteria bacterium]|nr:Oxygen-independent coproporphyrinogen-III oxidase-like protein [Acidobacteriota bacterium]